jgi:O-antigen/teichoic acid export membrane protein
MSQDAKGPEPQTGAAAETKPFLRHVFVYGLGTLVLQAASIVLLPLYTNYLAPSEYGVLEILYRIGDVLTICLMANGISLAAMTFYRQAKKETDRQRIASTVTLFLLAVLVSGGLLAFALADQLAALMGIDNTTLLMVGILAALLQTTTAVPLTLMQARIESGHFVCTTLAMFVCRVTLTIVAVAVLGWGVWGILGASILTSSGFGVVLMVRECAKGSFRPDMRQMRDVARFALPFVPGGLCFFVLHNGDRFFLVRFAGAEELGLYALGYKLATAVSMFAFVPLFKVWSAKMYDAFERPDAPVILGTTFTRMLAAYLFVGLGLTVLKDTVVAVLGSPEYARATAVIGPLVLGYFFLTASTLMDAAFYVRRRTGLKPWIALASAVVMLALYAGLIPPFGALGAAGATLGGLCFHAALTLIVSQRVFRVRYEPARLAAMLGLAIALALAARCLGSGLVSIPGKLALCALWPVLLWAGGVVSDEEKSLVLGAAGRALDRFRVTPAGETVESDA